MKKLCYIVSGIDKALAFEWICEGLDRTAFEIHFILLHHTKGGLAQYLENNAIPFLHIPFFSKKDLPKATWKIYSYLRMERIEVVHAHLLDAGLAGLMAAKWAGVKQRIYSRHHSSYHHTYYPKGVFYDKIINQLSTKLVAISEVVRKLLVEWEHVNPSKVHLIHHGFPLGSFEQADELKLNYLKAKYGIFESQPVIGVVARYTQWKGVQYIIPAFKKILEHFPKAMLLLANAKGEFAPHIQQLLKQLPVENYREIVFEDDLYSLFHSFDIFVHAPIDWHSEAFGQVYVEAMAAGVPSVFTLSGIANEIALDHKNCVIADYQDSESIYKRLSELLADPLLRQTLTEGAKQTVKERFELELMIRAFEKLYD